MQIEIEAVQRETRFVLPGVSIMGVWRETRSQGELGTSSLSRSAQDEVLMHRLVGLVAFSREAEVAVEAAERSSKWLSR